MTTYKDIIAARLIEKNITLSEMLDKIYPKSIYSETRKVIDLDKLSTAVLQRICNVLELDFYSILNGEKKEMEPLQKLRLQIENAHHQYDGEHVEVLAATDDITVTNIGSLIESAQQSANKPSIIIIVVKSEALKSSVCSKWETGTISHDCDYCDEQRLKATEQTAEMLRADGVLPD